MRDAVLGHGGQDCVAGGLGAGEGEGAGQEFGQSVGFGGSAGQRPSAWGGGHGDDQIR
nr:hypothetical protein [Nonomuraea aurantiaca]